jgi:hypothetical protein
MGLLLLLVLMLLPFFVGVFALLLVSLGNDMALSEESKSWSNAFIEVFLVDFDPMSVPGLFANRDTFEYLLLVGFERRQILRGEDICRTMKTGQLHELTHDFCRFPR